MADATTHNDIKVTVIVPFLNAQATIERCAASVLSQTLKEMEVIFVNDGSFDRGADLLNKSLKSYPDRIANVKIVHLPTRHGVYFANREAMLRARGKYLIRCDADDAFSSPDALQILVNAAERTDADIVAAPYFKVCGKRITRFSPSAEFPDINGMEIHTSNYSLCNKLISRELCITNNILPLDGIDCWDDLVIVARLLALKPRVTVIDTPVYLYYVDPTKRSLSRSSRDTQLRQHLLASLELERWFVERFGDRRYEPFLNRLKLIAKVKYLRGKHKDVDKWKKTFPEVNRRIMSITGVQLHYRLMFAAVAMLPTAFTQAIADQCDRFYK